MEGAGRGNAYVPARVRDYGDLLSLTADAGALLHVGVGSGFMAAVSAPAAPGGGGGPGASLSDAGGQLPFTGFAAALMGAAGAALSAAGFAGRRLLRRR
jgi:hypothetical protein